MKEPIHVTINGREILFRKIRFRSDSRMAMWPMSNQWRAVSDFVSKHDGKSVNVTVRITGASCNELVFTAIILVMNIHYVQFVITAAPVVQPRPNRVVTIS